MLIGYARTSTADQEARFEAQLACCEDVGTVKSSAVRTSSGYAIRSKPLLWPGRHSSACIRREAVWRKFVLPNSSPFFYLTP